MSMLPVVVLVGGRGTRLGALTEDRPKALVDINGEPFVEHQLRLLAEQRIERVVFCVGHLGHMIEDHVGDGHQYGLQVDYCHDGPTALGTAGALRQAESQLGEDFFVLYGDSYLPGCDYAAVQARYEQEDCLGLMVVTEPPASYWPSANVQYLDGRVLCYSKTGPTRQTRHIDYGLSILDRRALSLADVITPTGTPDLGDVFGLLAELGELAGYVQAKRFYEMGSLTGLAEIRKLLAEREPIFS